jgi:hypothetical protein
MFLASTRTLGIHAVGFVLTEDAAGENRNGFANFLMHSEAHSILGRIAQRQLVDAQSLCDERQQTSDEPGDARHEGAFRDPRAPPEHHGIGAIEVSC